MNCRPGDLARIVGLHPACGLNDKIVKLRNESPVIWVEGAAPQWKLEERVSFVADRNVMDLSGTRYFAGELVYVDALADSCLRPIRDPGSDAIDEMVAKVGPAPMTLTEVLERDEATHG